MNPMDLMQFLIFMAAVILVTKPLGVYMARVFSREHTFLDKVLLPLEKGIYRFCGIDPESEMRWTTYTVAMLLFNAAGLVLLFLILRLQGILPFNPMHKAGFGSFLAFNTAASFVSNTNWQAYSGESAAAYSLQMLGLTVQNFLSAATGMAVSIALFRGLTRRSAGEIGNFWADTTRCILWVLLPLSLVLSLVLISQGVVQNLHPYTVVKTIEGGIQTIAQGPVASQESIKMIGTNGGGFFNANSAHPFENPTPFTNFLEMLSIFALPAGLTYTFGIFARNRKQGWALFAAMGVLFIAGLAAVYSSEMAGNPVLHHLGMSSVGGNMEGKEVRFGIANSSLFAVTTTDASCGAVNASHDSFTPLGGGVLLLNIALGELVFGGVGSGMLGIIIFAVLAVFIAGLMVGRTPEYLGKKIEPKEMKLAMLAVLVVAASILCFSAIASVSSAGLAGRGNLGPHGLTEILYAFTSATGNNGSAFAGISADSPFYNLLIGIAALIGRFMFIVPIMAIAGSMVGKKIVPESSGTFPTTGGLFVGLLVGVILVVGALTFFPAYALGPIVEHYLMHAGRLF
jgi:K+-transporting ATPase ATPase A chain